MCSPFCSIKELRSRVTLRRQGIQCQLALPFLCCYLGLDWLGLIPEKLPRLLNHEQQRPLSIRWRCEGLRTTSSENLYFKTA